MAEKNTIKLLDEIKKQTKNDLIIFTTFTFDPIFFDAYMLRILQKNNPDATIIILMDFKQYTKIKDEDGCLAFINYGSIKLPATIKKNKIYGCQFHPEKSGEIGLNIINNFLNLG